MKSNASLLYSVILVIGDFLALAAAFVVAYVLRVTIDHTPISAHVSAMTYITILISLLPFWLIAFAFLGLYNPKVYEKRQSEFGRLVIGSFIGILGVISYGYLANITIFPARLVTVYGFLLAFCFVFVVRSITRFVRRQLFAVGVGINNVLIVGDTKLTHELIEALTPARVTGFRVVGVVGGVKHPFDKNVTHPTFISFGEALKKLKDDVDMIIQTELYVDSLQNDEILKYAQENHVAYRFVPGNGNLFVGNIEVELFHSIPVIAVHQTPLVGWGRVAKRVFDLVIGSFLLVLLSPFLLLIAIIIRLSGSGPVIFRQTRLTRYNQKFKLYKFRTVKAAYNGMTPEAAFEKMGKPELAIEYRANGDFLPADPRFTAIGRFLRKTSLDELPQLFNVIKGDISLVGPRPLIPEELALYTKRHAILAVKSGLTGLAQVSGRRSISFDERRTLDLYYVQNWSLRGDLTILLKTVGIVLFRRGAM